MPTIGDVAAKAGVSTATVSRVLNGKTSVDPALVTRVLDAASELNYRPHGPARSLRRRTTSTLTLVVPDVSTPMCAAMSRAFENVATRHGYSVTLGNSENNAAEQRRYLDVAVSERHAGIAMVAAGGRFVLDNVPGDDLPVVLASGVGADAPFDQVSVDVATATTQGVAALLEAGYRRVGCLTGPTCAGRPEDVLAGYRTALLQAGRTFDAGLVAHISTSSAAAVGAMLDAEDPPDALLIADDTAGALREITARGLRIGENFGLVAFDDAPWTEVFSPALSTIALPAARIGHEAAQLLLARIADADRPTQHIRLEAEVTIRASSAGV